MIEIMLFMPFWNDLDAIVLFRMIWIPYNNDKTLF